MVVSANGILGILHLIWLRFKSNPNCGTWYSCLDLSWRFAFGVGGVFGTSGLRYLTRTSIRIRTSLPH